MSETTPTTRPTVGGPVLGDTLAPFLVPHARLPQRRVSPQPGLSWGARALIAVQGSARNPLTITLDLLLLTGICVAVGVLPLWSTPLWASAVVTAGYFSGLYADRDTIQSRGVLWYPGRASAAVALVAFVGLVAGLSAPVVVRLVPAAILGLSVPRVVAWLGLSLLRRSGRGLRRTLIIGSDEGAETVWRKLQEFPEGGLAPVARMAYADLRGATPLTDVIRRHRIEHVVVVSSHTIDLTLASELLTCVGVDAWLSVVPPLTELFLHPGRLSELGGVPFIALGRVLRARPASPGKRAFDLVAASLALLFFAPVLLAAMLAVLIDDGRPIFYRQKRVGRHGETFGMLKLRSMVVGADRMVDTLRAQNVSDGLLFRVADDPRVTRSGRILRRLSIDELPQLWNVLRGEMSMVGPRPLPVSPLAFADTDNERHRVPPGITGYWQISGGNGLTYDEMIRLDMAYIRSWSLWLDIRLLLRTVPALVYRHDPA